jgi:peptidoglycan/xylan/chitin deacetylase (PgdA/CDA1 family)
MLNQKTLLFFALPLMLAASVPAAPADAPYIARYQGDAKAAFSYTFDDCFQHEVQDIVSVIDPLGIRGTFLVMPFEMQKNPTNLISWADARAMQVKGHEIGTHAGGTPKLHEADDAEVSRVVNGGWEAIRDNTGIAPVCFAYPGGSRSDDPRVQAIVAQRHLFVRGQVKGCSKIEGYGSVPGVREWTPEVAQARIRQAMAQGEWITAMVHAIINGYSPFKSVDEFRSHSEWLVKQGKDLWLAPMGEVGRYVREQDAAKLNIIKSEPAAVQFELVCDIKPKTLYNMPLTVVIPAASAKSATAKAGGKELPVAIRDGKILVDVPPGTGPVTVEWK